MVLPCTHQSSYMFFDRVINSPLRVILSLITAAMGFDRVYRIIGRSVLVASNVLPDAVKSYSTILSKSWFILLLFWIFWNAISLLWTLCSALSILLTIAWHELVTSKKLNAITPRKNPSELCEKKNESHIEKYYVLSPCQRRQVYSPDPILISKNYDQPPSPYGGDIIPVNYFSKPVLQGTKGWEDKIYKVCTRLLIRQWLVFVKTVFCGLHYIEWFLVM